MVNDIVLWSRLARMQRSIFSPVGQFELQLVTDRGCARVMLLVELTVDPADVTQMVECFCGSGRGFDSRRQWFTWMGVDKGGHA